MYRWAVGSTLLVLTVLVVWNSLGNRTPAPAPWSSPGQPRRIVSLTLASDEMLAELVPVEQVVGVSYLADDHYPAWIPRLRDNNPEAIIALHPDLVCVASYTSADLVELLERCGLKVQRNESFHTMDQIEHAITGLGQTVGAPDQATQLVHRLRRRRLDLARRLEGVTYRPRVLFWSDGSTSGKNTTIDDIIRAAGGRNAAAEQDLHGWSAISLEKVLALDPDVILTARWSLYDQGNQLETHPILRHLRAVRAGRIIAIEGRYLTSVSHFVIEGAERLAQRLHPAEPKSGDAQ